MRLLVILIVSVLVGCAHTPDEVVYQYRGKVPLNLKNPNPINLEDVNWILVFEDKVIYNGIKYTQPEFFSMLKKRSGKVSLLAITSKDYEKLSGNMDQILEWMILKNLQTQNIIQYYESKN